MNINIHAAGSGKLVRVVDRIQGKDVYDSFIAPNQTVVISVVSANGLTGDIDLYKRLSAQNPWTQELADYAVNDGAQLDIPD